MDLENDLKEASLEYSKLIFSLSALRIITNNALYIITNNALHII